mmetsp:Transcript_22067/g.42108  ORF Transcript_22067/g.42108 Transcript_22067/m.42108 type:complete len:219 (+) Transcript_22067:412-1068(+)
MFSKLKSHCRARILIAMALSSALCSDDIWTRRLWPRSTAISLLTETCSPSFQEKLFSGLMPFAGLKEAQNLVKVLCDPNEAVDLDDRSFTTPSRTFVEFVEFVEALILMPTALKRASTSIFSASIRNRSCCSKSKVVTKQIASSLLASLRLPRRSTRLGISIQIDSSGIPPRPMSSVSFADRSATRCIKALGGKPPLSVRRSFSEWNNDRCRVGKATT